MKEIPKIQFIDNLGVPTDDYQKLLIKIGYKKNMKKQEKQNRDLEILAKVRAEREKAVSERKKQEESNKLVKEKKLKEATEKLSKWNIPSTSKSNKSLTSKSPKI